MKRIAVIGAGSWGTALAIIAARKGHEVRLWSRNVRVVEGINREHFNPSYLREAQVPASIEACADLHRTLDAAELVILAAPSHATRELLDDVAARDALQSRAASTYAACFALRHTIAALRADCLQLSTG